MKKRITKEALMMQVAFLVSQRSTCSRLNVGTVITDGALKRIRSWGYNGNWAGGPNKCDSSGEGACECSHSEINALVNAERRESTDVMFVTDSPCKNCAKIIINSGIKKVYYRRDYRIKEGINLLRKAGVLVKKI